MRSRFAADFFGAYQKDYLVEELVLKNHTAYLFEDFVDTN